MGKGRLFGNISDRVDSGAGSLELVINLDVALLI